MANVKDIYNKIAKDFDNTRYKVWKCTSDFLNNLDPNSIGLEVGCGNGKNLLYRPELKIKGIDICDKFVELCKNKNLDVIQGDMIELPYDNNSFDFVFSIAALHHLNSKELRSKAIQEMFRVCKPNGIIFVLVWAFEQPIESKRKFTKTDELVSWKSQEDGNIYYRYYHLYLENELLNEFCETKNNFDVIKNFYELGNWGIQIKKLN